MSFLSRFVARPSRTLSTVLLAATTVGMAACSADQSTKLAPVLPSDPALTPQIRGAAFVFDVDRNSGRVKITAPNGGAISARLDGNGGISLDGTPNTSILAGDVVELTTSGLTSTTVGCAATKVCVSFQVSITNRLTGVELITPTWPTPPAGATGPLLFPFSSVTTTTTGGSSTSGDGTEIIVETPSFGAIAPNGDWDNAPHSFFNDTDCNATVPTGAPTDCYRSEPYPTIPAAGTTTSRTVGFTVDPTVSRFRIRALLVADLRSAVIAYGSVGGTVSSAALGGPVAGVTVSVGSRSAISDAAGAYQIDSVVVGSRTATVTAGLPAGCSATSVGVVVSIGATSTANFPLAGCTVPTGTVTGSILDSRGAGFNLPGIGVIITPNGGAAQPAALTGATGAFSATIPTLSGSAGRITGFTGVPANCTAPALGAGLFTYSGLTVGGTAAIPAITLTCVTPPTRYAYTGQWIAGLVDTVIYEGRINMSADQLSAITVDVQYDNARLVAVTGGVASSSINADLDSRTYNPALTPSIVRIAVFSLAGATTTGNVGLFRLKFRRIAAGTVTQISTMNQASGPAPALLNLVPRIDVTDVPLP